MASMKILLNFGGHILYGLFLFHCNFPGHQSVGRCDGKYGGCCDGFMYNNTLERCEECEVGYIGENCTLPCPFNSYGRECQMSCNCSKNECDFATGCSKETIGKLPVKRKEKIMRQSKNKPLKYALIGMFILLSILTIAYIGVHGIQWWCERKSQIIM